MKTSLRLALPALLATLLPLPLVAQNSPVFDSFSYQGRVTKADGVLVGLNQPVSREITIKIYDAPNPNGGTLLFAEKQNAIISNGEFSIIVGEGTLITPPNTRLRTALTGTVPSNGFWMGITVDDGEASTADPEISPRQKILAAPFAVRAATAENLAAVTQNMRLSDKTFFLSTGSDENAALRMSTAANPFGSSLVSGGGPLLYGNSGGVLGTKNSNGELTALQWGQNSVNITNRLGINTTPLASETLLVKQGNTSQVSLFKVTDINNKGLFSIESNGAVFIPENVSIVKNLTVSGTLTGTLSGNVTGNITGNATTATTATTANILSATGNSQLNSNALHLRSDSSHGLQYAASPIDGPRLFGFGGGALGSGGTANALVWNSAGNVGIGTTSPFSRLNVVAPLDKTNTTATRGFAVLTNDVGTGINAPFGLDVRLIGAATLAGRGVVMQTTDFNSDDGGNILMQPGKGNVGIGTSSPRAPLHVFKRDYAAGYFDNGTLDSTRAGLGNNGAIFDVDGSSASKGNDDTIALSALAAIFDGETITKNSVWVGNSLTFSDRRAKNIGGLSNSAADLKLLQQLKITDYTWIDRSKDQHRPHKQLIAQDVKEVFPQAVQALPTEQSIPDVYEPAVKVAHDAAAGLLHITTSKEHGFKAGDAVDLYGEKEDGNLTNVKVAAVKDAHEFSVKSGKPVSKVFVYGKRVTDFLTVDYDAIAMLNVSATQEIKKELDAEVQERGAEIKELRAENATLRAALEKAQASFETRLTALEKALPESGAAGEAKTVSTSTQQPVGTAAN